jgi:hypothetical protein
VPVVFLAILVALLGHDTFRVREAAHAGLARLAPLIWPQLSAIGNTHPDPEVAQRCHALAATGWRALPLEQRLEAAASIRPKGWGQSLPWIDGINYCHYSQAARLTGVPAGPPTWEDWRECTRLLVADLAAQGTQPLALLDVLERLSVEERCWWREQGLRRCR